MDLDALKKSLEQDFLTISSKEELTALKVKYLGKKGQITKLSKAIKELPSKEKPAYGKAIGELRNCLLYTSPSPRDATLSRMPSSA